MPGISAIADGTTSTGPDVRSHVESLTKMTLITAAPMNVAPGKANPYSKALDYELLRKRHRLARYRVIVELVN